MGEPLKFKVMVHCHGSSGKIKLSFFMAKSHAFPEISPTKSQHTFAAKRSYFCGSTADDLLLRTELVKNVPIYPMKYMVVVEKKETS